MRPTIMLVLGLLIILGTVTDVVAQAVTPYNIELTPIDRKGTSLIPVPSNTPSAPEGPGPGLMIGTPPGHLANAGGTFVPPPVVPGLGDGGLSAPEGPGSGPMVATTPQGQFTSAGGTFSGLPGAGDGGLTTPEGPGSGPMVATTPQGQFTSAGGTFSGLPGAGDGGLTTPEGPGSGPMVATTPQGQFKSAGGTFSGLPGVGDGGPTTPEGPGSGPMVATTPQGQFTHAGGTFLGPPGVGDGGSTTPGNAPGPRAAATGLGGILKKASATSHPCLPPNCGASVASANAAVPGIRTLQPRTSLSSSTSNVDSLRRSGSEKVQSAVALSGGNKTKINMAIPTSVPVLAKRAIDIKTPATLPPAQISGIKR
jgi:hypothetical protein